MRKASTTSKFDRRLILFVKFHSDLAERVKVTINKIIKNPFDQSLKTHKLSGSLKECLASNVTYEYRIVFTLTDETIWFLDIGSHDEVY